MARHHQRRTLFENAATANQDIFSAIFNSLLEGERWSVTAFALNLTDEKYLEEVIPAPEFGGSFDHPNARRRAGIEVSFSF